MNCNLYLRFKNRLKKKLLNIFFSCLIFRVSVLEEFDPLLSVDVEDDLGKILNNFLIKFFFVYLINKKKNIELPS